MIKRYLSIRLNAILHLIGMFLTIILVVFFLMRFIAFRGIEDLEQEQAILQLQRIEDGLAFTEEALKQTANDWSKWDETYFFLEGTNPAFVDDNFYVEAMDSIKVDMVMVYDLSKTLLYHAAYDFELFTSSYVDENIRLEVEATGFLDNRDIDVTMSGLITYQEMLMFVVVSPITKSDYLGDSNGNLVFIRIVDEDLKESLERIVGISFSIIANQGLSKEENIKLVQLGSHQINVQGLIFDINEHFDLMIDMTITMEATILVRDTVRLLILVITIVLFLFLVVIVLMLDKQMFKRIFLMRENIKLLEEKSDITLRLKTDVRKDEISFIGAAINKLLSRLETSYDEINELAYLDHLTGTHNRLSFYRHIDEQIIADETQFAILFLDLDGFKEINDRYGHEIGDLLLIEVSRRIQNVVGAQALISRSGGDEFLIYINTHEEKALATVGKELIQQLALPFTVEQETVQITVSIGIARYPDDGKALKEIIKCADIAMYQAKAQGKNQFQFYQNHQKNK